MGKTSKQIARSKLRWGIFGIFVLLFVTAAYVVPTSVNRGIDRVNQATNIGVPHVPEKAFNLGLDLQGGAHLVYQADVSHIARGEEDEALDGVKDVIERRVNGLGVSEPIIQTAKVGNHYRVIVELPGVENVNEAINMIGETPILEFKEPSNEPPRELTEEEQAEIDSFNEEAKVRADDVLEKAQSAEDFVALVKEYSDDSEEIKNNNGYVGFLREDTYINLLNAYAWAKDAQEGDVGLVEEQDGYGIYKRGSERDGGSLVSASHILICSSDIETCSSDEFVTKADAEKRAKELFDQANANNFEFLAKNYSMEPGADESGGDLGEFGPGRMVPAFETAVYGANVGEVVGPVETEFGYHVIYKRDERPTTEYELSRILVDKMTEYDVLPPQDQWKTTGLSGKQLDRSEVVSDPQTGEIQVAIQFDSEGKELFKGLTERLLGSQMAIFLDGTIISAPTIQVIIADGQAVITGGFTFAEARLLSQRLNAGALPVPVDLIAQQSVGASLGAESLTKSLKAGAVALVLVMIFMVLYYRLPGILAVIALSLYLSLTLAIFKLIGVTLTLAGIAGLILSIGMAVDANVLIFERLREELRQGKSLRVGVTEGFERAWTAIRDGNVSTVITCLLLIWFGSSFVQGFALTLMIGVLVSMFSAITITRALLQFIVPWFKEEANMLFLGARKQSK